MNDSSSVSEVVICLKGSEQSFKKKYLEYRLFSSSHEDPVIKELIDDSRKECKFEIDEIRVKASF